MLSYWWVIWDNSSVYRHQHIYNLTRQVVQKDNSSFFNLFKILHIFWRSSLLSFSGLPNNTTWLRFFSFFSYNPHFLLLFSFLHAFSPPNVLLFYFSYSLNKKIKNNNKKNNCALPHYFKYFLFRFFYFSILIKSSCPLLICFPDCQL